MGRSSTVGQLPPDILKKLQALLLDPRCTQLEATQRINAILNEEGLPAVSKSAVNRYAMSFEEMTAGIVETDRMATLMIAEMGISNQSDIGQATAELLRMMIMRFMPLIHEAMNKDGLDTKEMKTVVSMIKDLTSSQQQLDQSSSVRQKRDMEIKREAAKEATEQAAKTVEQAATARGLDADFATFLREKVLQGGV